MEVVLDTNFIISCIKQRLDYFSKTNEIIEENFEWVVPSGVMRELEEISKKEGGNFDDKNSAAIGLEMLRLIGPKIVEVDGKYVDQAIINYIKDTDSILATLDRALKKRVSNRILTIKDVKNLEVI
jgi:rRNA-processing protein FCF1